MKYVVTIEKINKLTQQVKEIATKHTNKAGR